MATRGYDVPGIQAEILDYQITPSPIVSPGEIVVLLGDLPDTVSMQDPKNPGSTISVSIPRNTPILINEESDLGIISGDEFKNALINIGQGERHLEIINVLGSLNSNLPLAVCKITRRNGERPDLNNTLELYEALEYAYENLVNYPAGKVVPMHVSIEDNVLMEELANTSRERFDRFTEDNSIIGTYGSRLIDNISSNIIYNNVDSKYETDLSYVATPVVVGEDLAIQFEFSMSTSDDFGNVTKTPFQTETQIVSAIGHNSIPTESWNRENLDTTGILEDGYLEAIYNMDRLLKEANNRPLNQVIPDDTSTWNVYTLTAEDSKKYSNIIDKSKWSDTILAVAAQPRKTAVSALVFSEDIDSIILNTIDIDLQDVNVNIGSFSFDCSLMKSPVGYDYSVSPLVKLNDVHEDYLLEINDITTEIDVSKWFKSTDDSALIASDNSGSHPFTLTVSDTLVIDPTSEGGIGINPRAYNIQTETISFDRSFNIVKTYDVASEEYDDAFVPITFTKDKNAVTNSAIFVVTDFRPSVNGVPTIKFNDIDVPLPGLLVSEGTNYGSYYVTEDYTFEYAFLFEVTLRRGLNLPIEGGVSGASEFEYEFTLVPNGASFDNRLVDFCYELTKELNDCTGVMGTIPPVTVSAEDIQAQVKRLSDNLSSKNYATTAADNGMYLAVTSGAQKVSSIGGITNFASARISSFDIAAKTVTIIGDLGFTVGDNVDLEISKRGRIHIVENTVASITRTANGFIIGLTESFDGTFFANLNNTSARTIYLTNLKDRKGTFLAALYAVEANNFGIDKAPFNEVLPGDSEIFYTTSQKRMLLDTKITAICREAFNTSGVVNDTPTMARDESDFTDQGTVGLIHYFIRQLRTIASPYKGQRFGSSARQVILNEVLEGPFSAQMAAGSIRAYDLQLDWSNLETNDQLTVEFSIREAKKLKAIKIIARLF